MSSSRNRNASVPSHRPAGKRGTASIEGVIVMPVLITLFLGTLALSRGYEAQLNVMNKVRGDAWTHAVGHCKSGAGTRVDDDSSVVSVRQAVEGLGHEKGIKRSLEGARAFDGSFRSTGTWSSSGLGQEAADLLQHVYGERHRVRRSESVATGTRFGSSSVGYEYDVSCNEETREIDDVLEAAQWGISSSGLLDGP